MVYAVMICCNYDNGDTSTELLDICSTKEKAQACLRLNAEYEWAENWENVVDTIGDLEIYEWTDDYVNFQNYDTRTTIYIVEKEIK